MNNNRSESLLREGQDSLRNRKAPPPFALCFFSLRISYSKLETPLPICCPRGVLSLLLDGRWEMWPRKLKHFSTSSLIPSWQPSALYFLSFFFLLNVTQAHVIVNFGLFLARELSGVEFSNPRKTDPNDNNTKSNLNRPPLHLKKKKKKKTKRKPTINQHIPQGKMINKLFLCVGLSPINAPWLFLIGKKPKILFHFSKLFLTRHHKSLLIIPIFQKKNLFSLPSLHKRGRDPVE